MTNLPLSTELKNLAVSYVLDDLQPSQIIFVEKLMNENPELLKEIRELQGVMGVMVNNVPQLEPPADLLDNIINNWTADEN